MSARKAYLFIVIAASLWGTISIYVKLMQSAGFDSMQVVAARSVVAAAVMTVYLLIKDKSKLKINPKDFYYFVGTGIVSMVLFNWCLFTTIRDTSVAVATVLLYTSPAFVAVMSAFLFAERMTPIKITALLMTFAGCALVTEIMNSTPHSVSAGSLLIGLASGFCFALYTVIGKLALKKYSSETVCAYTFIFAAAGALPLAFFGGQVPSLFQLDALIGSLGLAVFCSIIPFVLYNRALAVVESGKAAIISTLEPAVAMIIGIALYSETITLSKFLGMALILSAIILLNRGTSKNIPVES